MKKFDSRGFSIVELLAVVSILGILLSIAIPIFFDLVKNQNALMCNVSQQTFYNNYTNWCEYKKNNIEEFIAMYGEKKEEGTEEEGTEEEGTEEEGTEEERGDWWFDDNPFKGTENSYNSKENELEEKFRQSFIDYIGGEEWMPECAEKDNYYIIKWENNDLTIACYDKNGVLTELHNKS